MMAAGDSVEAGNAGGGDDGGCGDGGGCDPGPGWRWAAWMMAAVTQRLEPSWPLRYVCGWEMGGG